MNQSRPQLELLSTDFLNAWTNRISPGDSARTLFVTGTDTEIGKTFVAAKIASQVHNHGVRVGVYKPVASGCNRDANGMLVSDDAVQLWEAAGRPQTLEAVCPQRFAAPLAPPTAAAAGQATVDRELMLAAAGRWAGHCDLLIVEGAGGLLSPLDHGYFNADLAVALQTRTDRFGMIVVADNKLGVINHTLQTLVTAKSYNLNVVGVVLNHSQPTTDLSSHTNASELRRYIDPSIWFSVMAHQ